MAADLGCCATMAKYFLFICNTVFTILGLSILAVSLWIHFDDATSKYLTIVEFDRSNTSLNAALIVLAIVGAGIMLIGLLGCCGACKENSTMLTMYVACMVVIFIFEIAGVALIFYFKHELTDKLNRSMKDQVHRYYSNNTEMGLTKAWNMLQFEFECCGSEGYADYAGSLYTNTTKDVVPPTCCKMGEGSYTSAKPVDFAACKTEATKNAPAGNVHSIGCYTKLKEYLGNNAMIVGAICLCVAVFQIVVIYFACCVKKDLAEYNKV